MIDVNEPPVSIKILDTCSAESYPDNFPKVKEHSLPGTCVATVETLDRDADQKLKITFDDNGDGFFTLSSPNCTAVSAAESR